MLLKYLIGFSIFLGGLTAYNIHQHKRIVVLEEKIKQNESTLEGIVNALGSAYNKQKLVSMKLEKKLRYGRQEKRKIARAIYPSEGSQTGQGPIR